MPSESKQYSRHYIGVRTAKMAETMCSIGSYFHLYHRVFNDENIKPDLLGQDNLPLYIVYRAHAGMCRSVA